MKIAVILRPAGRTYLNQSMAALEQEVLTVFDSYLNCGILSSGCAYVECLDCNYSELVAFSCKQPMLCPSCSAKRAVVFSENLVQNVLKEVPQVHLVFTIPKRLRPYFKFNRALNKHLYQASWQTILEWSHDEHPGLRPAAVMSLHTAGDLLNWHPHVHGLSPLGAFDKDEKFYPFENINPEWLSKNFARNLFELLAQEPCIEPEVIENLKSWQNSGL